MKKYLLLFSLFCLYSGFAQDHQTLTYFANDTLKLELDLFLPKKSQKQPTPLLIHVHGGGFSGGERQSGHGFCKFLADNGFASATITYTLYAKGKKFSCDGVLTEKVKAFQYGVDDLWLATSFFLENAAKYNIDPKKIFVSGRSAGAETILHAAYWNTMEMQLYPKKLPADFRYAGLVSGAGAIMDLNLITKENVIPMFFFHGNGDVTVPYGTASHHYCKPGASGWLMLFGSYSIYKHAVSLDQTAQLFTYCGGGHEYSGYTIEKDPQAILEFLNAVLGGKKVQAHQIIKTGKSNDLSRVYNFCN
ncbi:MAG: alpha/beta hydrolase [Chitinophagaceae bacterium]|nr:MAG: alpha/beta hydrolase [Chitinophagaceae bacterium]